MILYLHGFASGPGSKKGRYFAERFRDRGKEIVLADLVPDFERITLTGQLEVMASLAAGARVEAVIGSSMGGYLAALYAARHPEVERVVCLAPAFDFAARWAARLGEEAMSRWRATRKLPVFHYGLNREAAVGWGLYEDALRYEAYPAVTQPVLLAHGLRDDVVPVEVSREFARRRAHAELREYDSGHELTDVLPGLWEATWGFLSR